MLRVCKKNSYICNQNQIDMSFFIDAMLESKDPLDLFRMIDETEELKLNRQFIMKDLGLTSRVFNHWIMTGLVTSTSKVGDYRYEFSFVELLWFNIVKELREYGFPLGKIKVVYQSLMEPFLFRESISNLSEEERNRMIEELEDHQENNPEYDEFIKKVKEELNNPQKPDENFKDVFLIPLHSYLASFMIDRSDIKFLINSDGKVLPVSDKLAVDQQWLKDLMDKVGFEGDSYISISLFKFLRKFIQKKQNQQFAKDHHLLNENELYILSLIRDGKAKSINIKFEHQKPSLIEITKERKVQAETRIAEVLLGRGYQDIVIKTQDGNITFTNIITKKKLK
jgi:DNA-binding transcriptional MerR regulator